MRNVHDRNFMTVWHRLLNATNPGLTADSWSVDGVDWLRTRHSYWGHRYSFQVESHILTAAGDKREAWSLWVVIERWWGEKKKDAVKSVEWSRVMHGEPGQVLVWFREQARKRGFE